ncbi:NrfD/PsrC family molybdoenzyme membrane anchor subunit [Aquibaculum arenosum]|uniref:Polysulfide reductase NrfD n=1 Tax=Aquibaculum arenosum TaxID=3032591 RepID=A0ABT5YNQ8_9PROT|nr:NrfD/PsrC family molybdoenzyme membrane anchor subunit [Fodinicurvata sp. CAU 1616]MDF2096477.1 polysulfide reductase NrfD [Fodinicurvata sp. CAU 1616]
MNSPVIEILAPRYEIAWYPWAVQYFFLVALAYCSVWLALPGLLFGRNGRWAATARYALLAAMTTAICAPIALLADLHQPLRFWHFYAHFTSTSWMSIGSLLLPPFVFAVIGLAWLVWREPMLAWRERQDWTGRIARIATLGGWQTPHFAVRILAVVAAILSLSIMVYTGSEIAVVEGRPLWNTIWLPPLLLTTGMMGAAGLVLLLNRVAGPWDAGTDRKMLGVITLFGLLTAGVVLMWGMEGLFVEGSSIAAAIDSVRHEPHWRNTAIWGMLAGAVLTLAAGLMLWRAGWSNKPKILGPWILGLVALHMAWMARWVVLMHVQTVQKQTAGYSEYIVGWQSSGWGGVIGIFGLWLAVILIIDIFVPWRAALGGSTGEPRPAPLSPNQGVATHG